MSYGINYQQVPGADIFVDLRYLRTPGYDHQASRHNGNRPPKRPSGLDVTTRMAVESSQEAQQIFSAVMDHIDSISAERTDEAVRVAVNCSWLTSKCGVCGDAANGFGGSVYSLCDPHGTMALGQGP